MCYCWGFSGNAGLTLDPVIIFPLSEKVQVVMRQCHQTDCQIKQEPDRSSCTIYFQLMWAREIDGVSSLPSLSFSVSLPCLLALGICCLPAWSSRPGWPKLDGCFHLSPTYFQHSFCKVQSNCPKMISQKQAMELRFGGPLALRGRESGNKVGK